MRIHPLSRHPHPRRAHAQPEGHLGLDPDGPADGHHGGLRVREVLARLRHALRRGAAPLRRVPLDLRAPVLGAARPARRGLDRAGPAGDRARAEERRAQRALDRRDADGDPRLAAPAVRARRNDVLPLLRRPGRPGRSRSRGRRADDVRSGLPAHPGGPARLGDPRGKAKTRRAAVEKKREGIEAAGRGVEARRLLPRALSRGGDSRDRRRRLAASRRGRKALDRRGAVRRASRVSSRDRRGGGYGLRDGGMPHGAFRRTLPDLPTRPPLPGCGVDFRDPTPALFAFNSPLGACQTCQGFGRVIGVDLAKVVPDPGMALSDRPIAPWNTPGVRIRLRRPLPRLPAVLRAHRRAGRAALGARARGLCSGAGASSTASTASSSGWRPSGTRSTSGCCSPGTARTRSARVPRRPSRSRGAFGPFPRADDLRADRAPPVGPAEMVRRSRSLSGGRRAAFLRGGGAQGPGPLHERRRSRLPDALARGADALGRRGAADRPRLGARGAR